MRIISKFNDYYDSVQAHGVDLTLVFQRKTLRYGIDEEKRTLPSIYSEILEEKRGEKLDGRVSVKEPGMQPFWRFYMAGKSSRPPYNFRKADFEYGMKTLAVGLCGNIRPCIKFTYGYPRYNILTAEDTNIDFAYTLEQADKIIDNFPKFLQSKYLGKEKTKREQRQKPDQNGNIYNLDRDELEQFFKVHSPVNDDRLFLHFKAPILTLRSWDKDSRTPAIHINDALNEVMYVKIADPFLTYQEIAQYISGVLGVGEPDTVDISDNDTRDKKGFFDMSFKKDPGIKKPRRRGKKRV